VPFISACAALGCTDIYVFPAGEGGAAPGTSVGTSSSATSSSGSGYYDETLIPKLCAVSGDCFPSCAEVAVSFQFAPCQVEGAALVLCMAAHYDAETCSLAGCDDELAALLACRVAEPVACSPGECGTWPDQCYCRGGCESGEQRAQCQEENEYSSCTCFLNTLPVGTCNGPWDEDNPNSLTMDTCGFGCCAAIFGSVPKPGT
jgi:hypothetical protein